MFHGSSPFSLDDWKSIKRFLSKDSPLIRAYGAMRFDARTVVSPEWKAFGSFYFIIPQVEFNELSQSSMLALNVAWDNKNIRSWHESINELKVTLEQISPYSGRLKMPDLGTIIVSFHHFPSKGSWDMCVEKALDLINGRNSELVKVVLARCSRYTTDTVMNPLALLACLKVESQNAYQFYIQPHGAPAFIGNTPEQLFRRKYLNITSEALAGTRARGITMAEDFLIGQDLLCSPKDNIEFTVVRESIRSKLEVICNDVIIEPCKALRKLPRVQHLWAQLSGSLRNEDDEFEILTSLHPTPAICGLPREEARQFIEDNEMFDRGMYAGPVGWFGGIESEFAVGIRSALVGKDLSTLVYAGAGIVKGTNSSSEWQELDLKTSQFTKFLQYQKR